QWKYGDIQAFKPWAAKLRPQDRIIIRRPRNQKPEPLPNLEWREKEGLWIGRPMAADNAATPAAQTPE
ncbi:MAG TPA: hypothetical protein DCM68_05700, partial [Verrucomicrobia bacterium]|nr:hypothetical protein [Verrucomicrobiota bacterium]